ncbi:hypothetical protein WA158_006194 [Blastocystis sp. Blastoise]
MKSKCITHLPDNYKIPAVLEPIAKRLLMFDKQDFIKYVDNVYSSLKINSDEMVSYIYTLGIVYHCEYKGQGEKPIDILLFHKDSISSYPTQTFYYDINSICAHVNNRGKNNGKRLQEDQIRHMILMAYIRNLRRIYMRIQDPERWRVYQDCLYEAVSKCHPEAVYKLNLQKDYLSKMINPLPDEGIIKILGLTEVTDSIILKDLINVPRELVPYIAQALLAFDEIKKKHDRDYSHGNYESPYLHWQAVFPTNPLSSRD